MEFFAKARHDSIDIIETIESYRNDVICQQTENNKVFKVSVDESKSSVFGLKIFLEEKGIDTSKSIEGFPCQ